MLLVAAAARGFAQDADDPLAAGLVIRSTTSLVQVRVVAEDSKGRAVSDLLRKDFRVQDDGKAQPITLFAADRGTLPGPASPRQAGGEAADTEVAAAGYSLILLDWLNTPYGDRYQAQQQVIRLLKRFQPRQQVAVYLLGHEPRLLHDFTSEMGELVAAVEEAGLEWGGVDNGPNSPFDARYGGKVGPRPSVEEQLFFLNNQINDTFHTFELIADRLAHVPGRKSLIWLSNAFPLEINSSVIRGANSAEVVYYQNLERLLARLNRADVAVYGVDAAGLSTTSKSYAGTMEILAERTGGTAFSSRNDLDEGMRLALEDMRVSYTLGFHVPAGALAGVHEIRIRVNRPGIRLRYRESYQLAEAAPAK
jgi:VWFA-related protein